jgi:hypothetical protein
MGRGNQFSYCKRTRLSHNSIFKVEICLQYLKFQVFAVAEIDILVLRVMSGWKWKQYVPPKHWYPFTRLYVVIIPKTAVYVIMYSNILVLEESREMGLLPSYRLLFILKAIPVTDRGGSQRCETSRFLYFLNNWLKDGGEVVSLTR